MIIITAFILLLIFGYWCLQSRKRHQPRTVKTRRTASQSGKFHAVSVKTFKCNCNAVEAIKGKRFLTSGIVPKLPVPNCTVATCTCSYVHHPDQRNTWSNRRAAFGAQTDLYCMAGETERRKKRGRRTSDHSHEATSDLDYAEIQWSN